MRSATKVKDYDFLVLVFFIQAVGQGSRRGLIDNPLYFKPRNFTGFLGSLPLGIVEVGRDGNYRTADGLTEIILGCLFHFLQNHRREFLGGVKASVNVYPRGVVVSFDDFVRHPFGFLLGF